MKNPARSLALLAVLALMTACQNAPPQRYHGITCPWRAEDAGFCTRPTNFHLLGPGGVLYRD